MREPSPLTHRHLDDLPGLALFVSFYSFVEDSFGSFVVSAVASFKLR